MRRDSSIGIAARLPAGWSGARIPAQKRDVPSPVRPVPFYCPPRPLFNGESNSFTRVKVCVPTCLNGIDRDQILLAKIFNAKYTKDRLRLGMGGGGVNMTIKQTYRKF